MSRKSVKVSGYTKSDGTYVRPHTRSAPSSSNNVVKVSSYTKSDGTYVNAHTRSMPSSSNNVVKVSSYTKSDGTYVSAHTRSFPSRTYKNGNGNAIIHYTSFNIRQNVSQENKTKVIAEKVIDEKKILVIYPSDMAQEIKDKLQCSILNCIILLPTMTNCGSDKHIFSQKGIEDWIKIKSTCPICRGNITELKDLDKEHEIYKNLELLKICYNDKTMTYLEFIKNEYCVSDQVEVESVVDSENVTSEPKEVTIKT